MQLPENSLVWHTSRSVSMQLATKIGVNWIYLTDFWKRCNRAEEQLKAAPKNLFLEWLGPERLFLKNDWVQSNFLLKVCIFQTMKVRTKTRGDEKWPSWTCMPKTKTAEGVLQRNHLWLINSVKSFTAQLNKRIKTQQLPKQFNWISAVFTSYPFPGNFLTIALLWPSLPSLLFGPDPSYKRCPGCLSISQTNR